MVRFLRKCAPTRVPRRTSGCGRSVRKRPQGYLCGHPPHDCRSQPLADRLQAKTGSQSCGKGRRILGNLQPSVYGLAESVAALSASGLPGSAKDHAGRFRGYRRVHSEWVPSDFQTHRVRRSSAMKPSFEETVVLALPLKSAQIELDLRSRPGSPGRSSSSGTPTSGKPLGLTTSPRKRRHPRGPRKTGPLSFWTPAAPVREEGRGQTEGKARNQALGYSCCLTKLRSRVRRQRRIALTSRAIWPRAGSAPRTR